ncbi:cell division protein CrgA [Actinomyces vulturis]|uniref:cell division protein CrgA n=1 Tax=Actinomyces vulturis TaxID=1857645 RepID=UPI000831A908|nr:cell division protein CrgA [Actinomyces vulturis]
MPESRKRVKNIRSSKLTSGNPAKLSAEESRAAASRVSRTPAKVKDPVSPSWYAPLMVGIMTVGLLWVVITYLTGGEFPIPWFFANHRSDWLANGNLYIGFLSMFAGFLGLLRWH